MNYIGKLKDYLEKIKKDSKIALFYHGFCGDGVCSAVITTKSLERILKRKTDLIVHQPKVEFTEKDLQNLISNKITHVVFVDLAIYKSEDIIKKAEKIFEILIIDHHEFIHDINSEKTTFIHSTFVDKDILSHRYPASKLTYDLFLNLVDINDLDWLSCLGLISDRGYDQWKIFVQKTMRKYNVEIKEDVFLTEFGTAIINISTSKRFQEINDEVFSIIYNAKSHKSILENNLMNEYRLKINEELQYYINNRNKSEVYDGLIIYHIKPKYKVGSTLSTVLSFDYFTGKTVVVIEDRNEIFAKISARDQNIGVRVNDLLDSASKDLKDAKSGGHAPAAGATIRTEDIENFKKKLIEAYNMLILKKNKLYKEA